MQSGLYTVEITNENGCKSQATVQAYLTAINELTNEIDASILNNPGIGQWVIQTGNSTIDEIEMMNVTGQRLMKQDFISSEKTLEIDASEFPAGIYFLMVHSGMKMKVIKLVRQ